MVAMPSNRLIQVYLSLPYSIFLKAKKEAEKRKMPLSRFLRDLVLEALEAA